FVEASLAVVPGALKRQESGITVQTESQGAASITHAIQITIIVVCEPMHDVAKAENVSRGNAVRIFQGQTQWRGRTQRQENGGAKKMRSARMRDRRGILVHQRHVELRGAPEKAW